MIRDFKPVIYAAAFSIVVLTIAGCEVLEAKAGQLKALTTQIK